MDRYSHIIINIIVITDTADNIIIYNECTCTAKSCAVYRRYKTPIVL